MPKSSQNLVAMIEAVLFAHGEPITIKKLAKILKSQTDQIETALDNLASRLNNEDRGLTLIKHADQIRLVTKPEFGHLITDLAKADLDPSLTSAALETLTIILYLSPVSRAEIDYIRGVNSSFTLRSLILKGLVIKKIDPKRPYIYLYEPTFDLIGYLGLNKVSDLPDYDKYHNLLTAYEQKQKQE